VICSVRYASILQRIESIFFNGIKKEVKMRQKLVKHGDSYALVIERSTLELLKINPQYPVSVTTDGKKLILQDEAESIAEDANDIVSDEFKTALNSINQQYATVLKNLA
jgi:hypothetical protein